MPRNNPLRVLHTLKKNPGDAPGSTPSLMSSSKNTAHLQSLNESEPYLDPDLRTGSTFAKIYSQGAHLREITKNAFLRIYSGQKNPFSWDALAPNAPKEVRPWFH